MGPSHHIHSLSSRAYFLSLITSRPEPLCARLRVVVDSNFTNFRNYKAPTIKETVDLPTKFSAPVPPQKPEVEGASIVASAEDVSIVEEAWPALYNPIDDPANYNHDFD
ncbi:hypothetical protein HK096_007637, partial [Nowakowskiella sp. JEL0078]